MVSKSPGDKCSSHFSVYQSTQHLHKRLAIETVRVPELSIISADSVHPLYVAVHVPEDLDMVVSSAAQHVLRHGPVHRQDLVLMTRHVIQGRLGAV